MNYFNQLLEQFVHFIRIKDENEILNSYLNHWFEEIIHLKYVILRSIAPKKF